MDVLHNEQRFYCQTFYVSNDCSMLELDVRYDWRVLAPNKHHGLFLISDFACLHEQLENYTSYLDIQHIERLFYNQRHSLCSLGLRERSG